MEKNKNRFRALKSKNDIKDLVWKKNIAELIAEVNCNNKMGNYRTLIPMAEGLWVHIIC